MEPVEPREAASVILLRGGAGALEVLLARRNPASRFMGGAWVFPGGALEPADGSLRATAVREVAEEVGVALPGPEELLAFSRWITPKPLPIRFDTHFFLALAPDGAVARVDGAEMVDAGWFAPAAALAAHARGELDLVFPTIKHLEQLAPFASAAALVASARGREIVPVEPELRGMGEHARLVLPGESG
jgi:8-oxo-dGTP pyrophosphatase MutT (NUDIX family)